MEKDVAEFIKWAVGVGCPMALIPSENKLKEVLRAKLFDLNELKGRYRAAQESGEIRERSLRVNLCKIKKGNFLVDRETVSWEYLQYRKLMATKKEILRVESNIHDLKEEFNSTASELNERKHAKTKCKKDVECNLSKMHYCEVNSSILEDRIRETTKAVTDCESAMCFQMKETDIGSEGESFKKLLETLKIYYAKAESENQEDSKSALWKSYESILSEVENSVACREIFHHFGVLLDATKDLQERNILVPNEEKERLYEHTIGLKRLMTDRLKLIILSKHYRGKKKEKTATYIEKYEIFKDALCKKICYCGPQFISEYVQLLLIDAIFKAKIEFLKNEIAKNQACGLEDGLTQNLQTIRKDVEQSHRDFLSKASKVKTNIFMMMETPLKLDRSLESVRDQVNGLKKTIAKEKEMQKINQAEFRVNQLMQTKPSIRSKEDEAEFSLTDDTENPESKQIVPVYEEYDIKLPITEKDCERYAKGVQETEAALQNAFKQTETLGTQIQGNLGEAQVYFNFLLDNPMRKYIPPTEKFNGHTYQEYETEFMMYYRQNSANN